MGDLKDWLRQQLDELDVLRSIFPGTGEVEIEDNDAHCAIVAFVRDIDATVPVARLSYQVHLAPIADAGGDVDAPSRRLDVVVMVRLPHGYPDALPELYVTSNELSRNAIDELNFALQEHMRRTVVRGEVCLLSLLGWVQDEARSILERAPTAEERVTEAATRVPGDRQRRFCRMWLYMHHIYSKTKRRDILSLSSELQLTGFCLPGKPGVVCVEGDEDSTEQFYGALRRWNWKSIACVRKDVTPLSDSMGTVDTHRKIRDFQELVLGTHSNHADMGQFLEYLKLHELDYAFKDLFGIEGQSKAT